MPRSNYKGLLFIVDPHLASRIPGFRKDNYPETILAKLRWSLDYARNELLLPALLGDLFHYPRDNDNRLLGEVIRLLGLQKVVGIYGNHDCRENELGDNDSFSVVLKAKVLQLLDRDHIWKGQIGGRRVILGGTPWGKRLPESLSGEGPDDTVEEKGKLVIWVAHHDVSVPGYEEEGYFGPYEMPGVDVVINGHIHRHLEDVQKGQTLWVTPGGITRIARSDATREHTPSVLRVDITEDGFDFDYVVVPHEPFDEIFHEELVAEEELDTSSSFIAGLAELEARRTESGAGLKRFLEQNIDQFEKPVAEEILALAEEVTESEQ